MQPWHADFVIFCLAGPASETHGCLVRWGCTWVCVGVCVGVGAVDDASWLVEACGLRVLQQR